MKENTNIVIVLKAPIFKHVLDEALKNDIHIETSSAFDIDIIESLERDGKIDKETYIICNGFKREQYITNIAQVNKQWTSKLHTGYR